MLHDSQSPFSSITSQKYELAWDTRCRLEFSAPALSDLPTGMPTVDWNSLWLHSYIHVPALQWEFWNQHCACFSSYCDSTTHSNISKGRWLVRLEYALGSEQSSFFPLSQQSMFSCRTFLLSGFATNCIDGMRNEFWEADIVLVQAFSSRQTSCVVFGFHHRHSFSCEKS